MNISFLGAAKTVTGSCFLLETSKRKVLIDCGMYQGQTKETELNNENFAFNPAMIDCVLLTHAHIDHSGRIPKLYLDGFKGEIITTKATAELCEIMLPDSGHIQEMEIEWLNKKRARQDKHLVKPLYTMQDAVDCLKLFKKVKYDEEVKIGDDIRVKFRDAGHILGSAILEIWVSENDEETKVVFTGDLGNQRIPMLREPTIIEDADYVIMESTYGDRKHSNHGDKAEEFLDIVTETINNGGNVVIPSFAVGRTQEILYNLHKDHEKYKEKLKKLKEIPVYVDSPLAVSATQIFENNTDCFDEEASKFIASGDNPLDFPELHFTRTADESKALNDISDNIIIISASGMCEAGRIKHHLKHNLWKPESTILFVGYQAQGTLGRKILDGAKKVKIFGEEISVNARIESIDGFSGHADQDGLMRWLGLFKKKPSKVFLVHGDSAVQDTFAGLIKSRHNLDCVIPDRGEVYTISGNEISKTENTICEVKQTYVRLAILEYLETLKEELNELTEILKADLKEEKDDEQILMLKSKLKNLEQTMVNVLK
ncbi:MAG: MBL fold metallo-hydrolase RNA specificity domain-containing protein [Ignavibacteriales bacterium]